MAHAQASMQWQCYMCLDFLFFRFCCFCFIPFSSFCYLFFYLSPLTLKLGPSRPRNMK